MGYWAPPYTSLNMLRTLNSFAKSDTGVVVDSEPHPSHMCKTSLFFAPLAVRIQAGYSAFPFYTLTNPLIRLNLFSTKLF